MFKSGATPYFFKLCFLGARLNFIFIKALKGTISSLMVLSFL